VARSRGFPRAQSPWLPEYGTLAIGNAYGRFGGGGDCHDAVRSLLARAPPAPPGAAAGLAPTTASNARMSAAAASATVAEPRARGGASRASLPATVAEPRAAAAGRAFSRLFYGATGRERAPAQRPAATALR
jgi:hypothetical protein